MRYVGTNSSWLTLEMIETYGFEYGTLPGCFNWGKMMKRLSMFLIPVVLLLLVSCSRTDDDSAAGLEAAPSKAAPVLQAVEPVAADESSPSAQGEETAGSPTLESEKIGEAYDAGTDSTVETGSAAAAEVDLSQVTSEALEGEELVVAPRPGVPDPEEEIAHMVSQDLAQRLAADISDLDIVSVESVEWSDSSLGCPAPDLVYLSVITPGYKIILEATDEMYAYHSDSQGNFVLCGDDGRPVVP